MRSLFGAWHAHTTASPLRAWQRHDTRIAALLEAKPITIPQRSICRRATPMAQGRSTGRKHSALPGPLGAAGWATCPTLTRPAPTHPQSGGGEPWHPRPHRWPKPHAASTSRRRSPSDTLQSPASVPTTWHEAVTGTGASLSAGAGSIRCLSGAAMGCIDSNFQAPHLDADHAEALSASARSVRSQLNSGSSRPKCP